eukprot:RCo041801
MTFSVQMEGGLLGLRQLALRVRGWFFSSVTSRICPLFIGRSFIALVQDHLKELHGVVLEVGAGDGRWFVETYGPSSSTGCSRITKWIGVEPEPGLYRRLVDRTRAVASSTEVSCLCHGAESLPE